MCFGSSNNSTPTYTTTATTSQPVTSPSAVTNVPKNVAGAAMADQMTASAANPANPVANSTSNNKSLLG